MKKEINKSDKYYLLTHNADWADEHDVPSLECFNEKDYNKWLNTKIYPSASLGNGGDSWCEELNGITGRELINSQEVDKVIVDESFYKIFKKAALSSLSLGNIFDFDQYDFNENDEDEDEVEE